MSRWEPNAKGRLEQAALDLYQERGFEQTMVTEIAKRAGLTERTFFRYFADKREVLFGGQDRLHEIYVSAIANAPTSATPLDAVAAALEAAIPVFRERHELVRLRQAVIAVNPELQEREMLKSAALTSVMADALRSRGVTDSAAILAAEVGFITFKTAYDRWVSEPDEQDLSRLLRGVMWNLNAFVTHFHRLNEKVTGMKFCLGVVDEQNCKTHHSAGRTCLYLGCGSSGSSCFRVLIYADSTCRMVGFTS